MAEGELRNYSADGSIAGSEHRVGLLAHCRHDKEEHLLMAVPKHTEEILEDLAAYLQVPPSRYEAAERSYKSVGEWLHREQSSIRDADPDVYIQGSFQLGTAIRPASAKEDYDVDLVCELSLQKTQLTQAELKALLGIELRAYANAHQMKVPKEGRRCWTLDYADEAQFHMDTLPAIPDGPYQRLLLEHRRFSTKWAETAIAITDQDHPDYRKITQHWPHSNPRGYADWFRSRMREIFQARRQAMALEARASMDEIPEYKVRTPLQSAVQILKRHRDVTFAERPDDKPISIILTTLAAHAYQQEPTIAGALYSILDRMDAYIEYRDGVPWVENPTDPAENFADRWKKFPEREAAFREWLDQAREDFAAASRSLNHKAATAALQPRLGRDLMEAAAAYRHGSPLARIADGARHWGRVLNPVHRTAPPWTRADQGEIRIERAMVRRNGFRPECFMSDGDALPKGCDLTFHAETNIPKPFKVYWQVVNTGAEANAAGCLRGGFDEGLVTDGRLSKNESTLYTGIHSIECFIVKQGLLAARSGQFIVNIQ